MNGEGHCINYIRYSVGWDRMNVDVEQQCFNYRNSKALNKITLQWVGST
jgi:hypothetical protein